MKVSAAKKGRRHSGTRFQILWVKNPACQMASRVRHDSRSEHLSRRKMGQIGSHPAYGLSSSDCVTHDTRPLQKDLLPALYNFNIGRESCLLLRVNELMKFI